MASIPKPACYICQQQVNDISLTPICDSCKDKMKNQTISEYSYSAESFPRIVPSSSLEQISAAISKSEQDEEHLITNYQKKHQISNYYHSVTQWIDVMNELNQQPDYSETVEDKNEANFSIRCATYCSFGLNMMLLMGKALAMSTSASYTIMSSLADSCLDIIAGIIISCTAANSKMGEGDHQTYPIGKSRISTVGILVFSILMSCCAVFIIMHCLHSLLAHEQAPPTTTTAMFVMCMTIIVKFSMWIVYTWLGHPITLTLAEDHRNDVFTNSFGLFMYWGGAHFRWWMDSAGGLIISLFILYSWQQNAVENAKMLIGIIAPPDIIRNLTYVAAHHHPLIKSVTKVVAYQIGPNYFAEVHIVVQDNIRNDAAFWVADSLQRRLERVDGIEHAFVHLEPMKHDPDLERILEEFNVQRDKNYRFPNIDTLSEY